MGPLIHDCLPGFASKPSTGDDEREAAARAVEYQLHGLWTVNGVVVPPLRIADTMYRCDGTLPDGTRITVWVLCEL